MDNEFDQVNLYIQELENKIDNLSDELHIVSRNIVALFFMLAVVSWKLFA